MPVPYRGDRFTFRQPDGSAFEVRLWGNQSVATIETLDGHTVLPDPRTGYYHYALLSPDRTQLQPTGPRVGEADPADQVGSLHLREPKQARRARAAAGRTARATRPPRWQVRGERRRGRSDGSAVVGDYRGLCLLVQFPDVPGLIPVDEVDRFCNQVGYDGFGNNGSVYDYYSDVSGGLLRYTSLVADYYTTKHPRDYYTDPQEARGEELTREALDALLATGVDLSGLTTDHEGYIQALNVFYAGPCVNNWAEGLWPYSSSMDPYGTRFGSFHDYQVTNLGDGPVLGVYCHENGHMICDYPDLYDKDDIGNGVGSYCLMGYFTSPTNPCQIGAYLKDVAGWTGDRIVASPGTTVTLTAGRNDFLVHDRSGTEYFIVENRQQEGRDAQLPDAGLTIWHVDRNGDNSAEQMTAESHYECSLEQADGRFDLEHDAGTGDPDDLFGGAAANRFGQNTVPDSRWWDGTASGLELAEISEPGPGMTLSVIPAGPDLGLRPSVIGTWPVVAVDWGPSGTAEPTYAFTFHPDGTWTTESNTGRWVQVDSTVLWTVDHLDLVYSGTVGERMLRGVMGYTALSLVTAQAGRFLALRGIPESSDGSAG